MFKISKNIKSNEEFRLMMDIEAARKDWHELQKMKVYHQDFVETEMLFILAEARYRFLFSRARKQQLSNPWYLDVASQREG